MHTLWAALDQRYVLNLHPVRNSLIVAVRKSPTVAVRQMQMAHGMFTQRRVSVILVETVEKNFSVIPYEEKMCWINTIQLKCWTKGI